MRDGVAGTRCGCSLLGRGFLLGAGSRLLAFLGSAFASASFSAWDLVFGTLRDSIPPQLPLTSVDTDSLSTSLRATEVLGKERSEATTPD